MFPSAVVCSGVRSAKEKGCDVRRCCRIRPNVFRIEMTHLAWFHQIQLIRIELVLRLAWWLKLKRVKWRSTSYSIDVVVVVVMLYIVRRCEDYES